MTSTQQLAKHIRQVYTGGNWTWSNIQDQLSDVTLEEALTKTNDLNTIATLTFHIHYFVKAITKVLENKPLDSNDKYSFTHPDFKSDDEWQQYKATIQNEAEQFALLLEKLPDAQLPEIFVTEKYGTYHRNMLGLIEHTHYHLGQIAIIKKLVRQQKKS